MKKLLLTRLSAALILAAPWVCLGAPAFTYTEHIAPVLQEHCVECHRDGESAPFSLETYPKVKRRVSTIARVIDEGFMPPWHAVGGDVPLLGDRRLSEDELATIRSWIDQGAPEGDPERLPPPRTFPAGWRLGTPDLVLEMEEAYALPAEGPDIYRNFVIPTGLKETRFLKAIEFRAGTPSVVHHSLFYLDTEGAARRADEEDPAPGFAEMPLGVGAGRSLGGWVPGSQPIPLPDGLAHRLTPGSDLILSTHFHLSGKPESERSKIGLYFTDREPTKDFTGIQLPPVFGAFAGIDIAPGDGAYQVIDTFELPVAVEAFGVVGHAHYRGKKLRLTAEQPGGIRTVLFNVPDWDISWQEEYRFVEAVALPAGTRLVSEVTWDNSPENPDNPTLPPVRVRWGRESFDEMGSVTLLVTAKNSAQMKTLRRHNSEHLRWQAGSHVLSPGKLAFAAELRDNALRKFDTDGDGHLDAAERAKAKAYLESEEHSKANLP